MSTALATKAEADSTAVVETEGAPVAKAPSTVNDLTGVQKLAILCISLGSESSSVITRGLTSDEVEDVTYEIARLDSVSPGVVDSVLREWIEISRAAGSLTEGGVDFAKELLDNALGPQRAASVLRRIQAQMADEVGLNRLRNVDPQQLGNMLRGEHPQTIALVLAHLQPSQTVEVLGAFEPEIGADVAYRMACMEKVSPEMLQLIERTLSTETDLAMSQGMTASGGPAAVAEVLNLTHASLEKALLEGIAERDPELSQAIKELMFVFEDLIRLDDRSIQRVLGEIDSKELALALKGAGEDVRNRLMSVMSKRAVEALSEEMDYLGPVRLRDVEGAQRNVVRKVRELEEAGDVVISTGADDEFIE